MLNMNTKDIFGNIVVEGDTVAFIIPRYSELVVGKVIRVTPKGFTITYIDNGRNETVNRRSYQVAKK